MLESIRIYPARLEWPPALDNLNDVSRSATRVRLVSKAVGFETLRNFKNLEALWCFGIDEKKLNHISECMSLKELYLDYNVRTAEISSLLNLPRLNVLRLDSCSKISSLEQLGEFKNLIGLAIENFKNVHDIKPLSALTNLRELAVEGSIWTRMKIESLAPIANLHNLQFLSLSNLKVQDESLQPLTKLTSLKEAHFANFYPFAEFARLAAKLPETKCQWFAPYILINLKCKKCRADKRVMLTGKGKPMLCQHCDATRLAHHVAEFERVKNSAH